MKILHLNFSDTGGAGIAVRRTHLALLKAGYDSTYLVARREELTPRLYELNNVFLRKAWRFVQLKYENWQKRDVEKMDKSIRSSNQLPGFILRQLRKFDPDIVHLHWVNAGMISLQEIQKISVPVVWTLHDAWPLNGSCHCAGSLMKEEMGAHYPSNFENVDSSGYSQKTGKNFRRKLKGKPEALVVLNRNYKNALERANWYEGRTVIHIPNCIDLESYRNFSSTKEDCKRKWKLPENKYLILFTAASIHSRHKGADLLFESVNQLDVEVGKDCALVVVGGGIDSASRCDIPCYELGFIQDEEEMRSIYKACDVFLCPSREDNFPNTVAESSALGLPVVAYNTGGLSDMVDHKQTGYLAECFKSCDFAYGIKMAIDNQSCWGEQAANKANELYDECNHVGKLTRLYKSML